MRGHAQQAGRPKPVRTRGVGASADQTARALLGNEAAGGHSVSGCRIPPHRLRRLLNVARSCFCNVRT